VRIAFAQDGDKASLQVAYIKANETAGAQLLATVEGRVEDRTPMEGSGTQPTLIVEKFVSVEPQGCSDPASTAQLENTYWKIMTLNGKSVPSHDGAREVHFVLTSENRRMRGFGGCNGMSGGYELKGDRLKFIDIARTLMACTYDMDTERELHEMFPRVAGWKITREVLQLTDDNGQVIAVFESRYMK
jgi:copper homeostasis protein (lipoprotein)